MTDQAGSFGRVANGEREAFLAEVGSHLTEPTYAAKVETHLYGARLDR